MVHRATLLAMLLLLACSVHPQTAPVKAALAPQGEPGEPLFISKTEENIVGLNPLNGKEHWRIPFRVTQDNTIVTPLVQGDVLLTSVAEKGCRAWKIQRKGASFGVQALWTNPAVSVGLSSPVEVAGPLAGYSHRNSGQLFALDAADRTPLWRGEPRWGAYVHVSLISRGGELLALRGDGRMVVALYREAASGRCAGFVCDPRKRGDILQSLTAKSSFRTEPGWCCAGCREKRNAARNNLPPAPCCAAQMAQPLLPALGKTRTLAGLKASATKAKPPFSAADVLRARRADLLYDWRI